MRTEGFSSRELVELGLPGAPRSHQGWEKHAQSKGWEIREHAGRGRGGKVLEFVPPPPLASLIDRHLGGEVLSVAEVRAVLAGAPDHTRLASAPVRAQARVVVSLSNPLQSRFAAWLMQRLIANVAGRGDLDESQLLDCHDLTSQLLLLAAERERMSLMTVMERPELAQSAVELALAAKGLTLKSSG